MFYIYLFFSIFTVVMNIALGFVIISSGGGGGGGGGGGLDISPLVVS